MITITFPDNSVKQFEAGVTPLEIARSLSPQLARDVLPPRLTTKSGT
jgi:threonyl-tRNA synthetase